MENSKKIKAILRVNHAGELGARQIYKGMRRILGNDPDLVEMAIQEEKHLKAFTQLMIEYKAKPTIFQPFWHVLSYGMGITTALLGKKAAHACTIAVEEIIIDHYQDQIDSMMQTHENKPLMEIIEQFKKEENDHKKIAEQAGGRETIKFNTLEKAVKIITKAAIKLSTKI